MQLLLLAVAVFLTACQTSRTVTVPPDDSEQSSSARSASMEEESSISSVTMSGSVSMSSERETRNVSYRGRLEKAGISIYMQGTHRLELPAGRFVLLESSTVDLDANIGKQVEVTGAVRPTVEAGGMIMRVESIAVLESSEEESSMTIESAVSSVASSIAASSAASAQKSSPAAMRSSASVQAVASTAASDDSGQATVSPAMQARIDAMAKEDLAENRWTQQYCTSHIGFCIPVHKNWWYKSFGTTTSLLWHVEISTEQINTLGQGPVAVNLLSGGIASKKATDGQVREQGDLVIGYREWTDNRHFEIRAPLKLKPVVEYIAKNLKTYDVE